MSTVAASSGGARAPQPKRRILKAPRRLPPRESRPSAMARTAAASSGKSIKILSREENSGESASHFLIPKKPNVVTRRPSPRCDFCGNGACSTRTINKSVHGEVQEEEDDHPIEDRPVLTCKRCFATAYCSTDCRDLHAKVQHSVTRASVPSDTPCFSYHTPAVCGAENVVNRTLVDKLADTIDSMLSYTIQRALIWLQRTPYARYWAQGSLNQTAPTRPLNRMEYCYVGWMTYVDPLEFVSWSSLAILEMHKWLVESTTVGATGQHKRQHQQQPHAAVVCEHSPSCSPRHCTAATKDDEEKQQSSNAQDTDLSWCGDAEVKSFAVAYHAWRTRLSATLTTSRIMTSDGQGRAITVHHSKWGEVFHVHLKAMDSVDQKHVKECGWDMVMCVRADRRVSPDQMAACWRFGERRDAHQNYNEHATTLPGNDHQNVWDSKEVVVVAEEEKNAVVISVTTPAVRVVGFHTLTPRERDAKRSTKHNNARRSAHVPRTLPPKGQTRAEVADPRPKNGVSSSPRLSQSDNLSKLQVSASKTASAVRKKQPKKQQAFTVADREHTMHLLQQRISALESTPF